MRIITLLALALTLLITQTNCRKKTIEPVEEPPVEEPSYTIPTTYYFGNNTNFTGSLNRVSMLRELVTYVRTAHTATANVAISSSKLTEMFNNTNARFNDALLNTSGVNLSEMVDNTYGQKDAQLSLFNELGTVSQTTVTGSDGEAGKVFGPAPTTTNGTQSAYLMNANGFEYKELIEKGMMGALLYSEGTKLLTNIASYNNETVVAGEGTAMEHAWDEAFGYFGVPVSFPTTTTGVLYWGSYCNSVNAAMGSNATIMNAWLKGRAAISNKDYKARDEARIVVLNTWEKVAAGRLITYLKQAKTNFAQDGLRNHALSESVGFINAFRYNPSKVITDADITLLSGYIGTNLYHVSQSNIDLAINKVAAVYGLDAVKF